MKTIQVIIISILTSIFHFGSVAQKVSIEKELYFVDTIEIKDPILVAFKEEKYYYNNVLVSKESLDFERKDDTSFVNFLSSGSGYLLFQAFELSCMLSNLSPDYLEHTPFYSKLQKHLYDAEKASIFVPREKGTKLKKHNGWPYFEIYPRKFLLFLAKASAIHNCQGKYAIKIDNMDNVYFKILCPVTW